MGNSRLLKVLSLVAFLLLMAPFYDHCNGHRMNRAEEATVASAIDTTAVENDSVKLNTTKINKEAVDTVKNSVEGYEMPIYVKAYEFIDDYNSENAFEMANMGLVYYDVTFKEIIDSIKRGIKKNDYGGFFFWLKNSCFILIVVVTFLISFFSFQKSKRIYNLSKLNLILLLISVICLFSDGLFKEISQIKWGYYAFIIINLLIFYYSKIQFQENKSVA